MSGVVTAMACPTSVAAGAAVSCLAWRDKTVQIIAVGTATYQLQGSLDNVTWVSEGAAFASTSGVLEVTKTYSFMRWNCTAYTNGTPTSLLAGHHG